MKKELEPVNQGESGELSTGEREMAIDRLRDLGNFHNFFNPSEGDVFTADETGNGRSKIDQIIISAVSNAITANGLETTLGRKNVDQALGLMEIGVNRSGEFDIQAQIDKFTYDTSTPTLERLSNQQGMAIQLYEIDPGAAEQAVKDYLVARDKVYVETWQKVLGQEPPIKSLGEEAE